MTTVVPIKLEKSLAHEVAFEVVLGRLDPIGIKSYLDLLLLGYLNLFTLYVQSYT